MALEAACRFFAPIGLEVELLSRGHLSGYPSALPIVITDPGRLTPQQADLYAHRDQWPLDEVVAFFVGSMPPMLCRGFSHPGLHLCVVAAGAPVLTLAHELGTPAGGWSMRQTRAISCTIEAPRGPRPTWMGSRSGASSTVPSLDPLLPNRDSPCRIRITLLSGAF